MFENRFSLCDTLPRLDRLLAAPEDRAVSDVDAVEPLNPVKMDDDETLLLRLSWSLERQLGLQPLEVADRALYLQPFPLKEFTSGSPNGRSVSDKPL